jgi:hypothetical protein
MSEGLVLCPGCSRHVREGEAACPFCRAVRAPSRAAALLAGAVLAAALSHGADARAQELGPRFTMEHGGGQGYGAPPNYDPMRERTGPVTAPAPTPPLDLSRFQVGRFEAPAMPSVGAPVLAALGPRRLLLARCFGRVNGSPEVGASRPIEFDLTPEGRVDRITLPSGYFSAEGMCVTGALRSMRVRLPAVLDAPVHVRFVVTYEPPAPALVRPVARPLPPPRVAPRRTNHRAHPR